MLTYREWQGKMATALEEVLTELGPEVRADYELAIHDKKMKYTAKAARIRDNMKITKALFYIRRVS